MSSQHKATCSESIKGPEFQESRFISFFIVARESRMRFLLLFGFTLLLTPFIPANGYIFNSPGSGTAVSSKGTSFESNACFKSNADRDSWLTRATSYQVYNRLHLPTSVLANHERMKVNISIDMNSMASVDDINSEYKLILKIDLEWIDQRLAYNCSNTAVTTPLELYNMQRIWSPTIGVPNIKDPDTSIIQGESTMILGQLRTDGYVHTRLR